MADLSRCLVAVRDSSSAYPVNLFISEFHRVEVGGDGGTGKVVQSGHGPLEEQRPDNSSSQ